MNSKTTGILDIKNGWMLGEYNHHQHRMITANRRENSFAITSATLFLHGLHQERFLEAPQLPSRAETCSASLFALLSLSLFLGNQLYISLFYLFNVSLINANPIIEERNQGSGSKCYNRRGFRTNSSLIRKPCCRDELISLAGPAWEMSTLCNSFIL